jgi:hypothetical protein
MARPFHQEGPHMRIKITASGIYGADGEIPVGAEFDVSEEPAGWNGRYVVVADDPAPEAVLTADNAPKGRK